MISLGGKVAGALIPPSLLPTFLVEGVTKFQLEVGENVLSFLTRVQKSVGMKVWSVFVKARESLLKFSTFNPSPLGNFCVTLGL